MAQEPMYGPDVVLGTKYIYDCSLTRKATLRGRYCQQPFISCGNGGEKGQRSDGAPGFLSGGAGILAQTHLTPVVFASLCAGYLLTLTLPPPHTSGLFSFLFKGGTLSRQGQNLEPRSEQVKDTAERDAF